jgi:hypothetical protein
MTDESNTKSGQFTAYAFKRLTRKTGHWLEIGRARAEANGAIRVFLDRLPIGGFTGAVLLSPEGQVPVLPEPQRPGVANNDDDEAEEV